MGESCRHPWGPLGLCSTSRRWKKAFLCCLLGFFWVCSLFCFVFPAVFMLDGIQRHDGRSGSVSQVDFIPKSAYKPLVCKKNGFYLQLSSHVLVSSSHNTGRCTPVNLDPSSQFHTPFCPLLSTPVLLSCNLFYTNLTVINQRLHCRRCSSTD